MQSLCSEGNLPTRTEDCTFDIIFSAIRSSQGRCCMSAAIKHGGMYAEAVGLVGFGLLQAGHCCREAWPQDCATDDAA